ncbi:hypothetical protein PR202_ga24265 [Eleusine coracana subsp. coracana]|uniref:Embryonic flower 1-like protein n=1 Tax=Eleusine coracana subsp. coracana TaxID=191504 RepID=A0AAV5D7Y4_ELECO|nr:hypothetical protein PR202_ga24265 [Eleusine coracana subsp. coracana]
MVDITNDIPMDDTHEAPQMISGKEEDGTHNLSSPKPCEVLNDDRNERVDDLLNGDSSALDVAKPVEHKGIKPISQYKGSQVHDKGPRETASKRNAGSSSKKKQNKFTGPSEISDLKFCQRKRKRMRRLSELIETDQTGIPTNSIDVDHARTNDICESDKGKISSEVEKDTSSVVSNQREEEIQSRTVHNKTKLRADDVDDRSSLMNWLKKTNKKVRTEKKDSGHRNVDPSAVSISTPGIPASEKLHQDLGPSVGDQSQEEDPATTNANHGSKNMQNNCRGLNVLQTHNLCHHEHGNSRQGSLSVENSTILLKRKVPSTDNVRHGGIKSGSCIVKKNRLKVDDNGQMASENSQKCVTKVSLGKCDAHNVSGTRDQKRTTNKKQQKLQMLDKQTDEMDDIPMDVVELLARHQHERQQMTDADSLENSHSRPKMSREDCDQVAAKDGSIDASTVLGTNFQESLTSSRKQKMPSHASLSAEAPNVHLVEELDTQMSAQEAPEVQMQNSLPVHAASISEAFHVYPPKLRIPDILMCTEEQQTQSHMDKEVTIACASPTFLHHQNIAEVPSRSSGTNRGKKLMWDSFKTASRIPSTSSYGAQFRSGFVEGGSASTHVFGASNNYPTYPPAVEHYTKKGVNQVSLRNKAMEAGRLYDQRISGQSGLYPRETMPATHLLRLMDSSTASGFTNRSRMGIEASGSSQYMQNQYKASLSASYGSHLIEKFPLTLEDLSRHQVPQNLHRPLRPLPRVGVLGSLLQQDIAKWSEHCGAHTGYRQGASKGVAPFDTNRKENCEAVNSAMLSARWNALQLSSVSSSASTEYLSPRYREAESWTRGKGTVVHPLDKLVKKDICQTNRNPADFTIISDENEYMRSC